MLKLNPTLGEAYFVQSFISGLDEEIQPVLLMLGRPDLNTAFLQARMEEMEPETEETEQEGVEEVFMQATGGAVTGHAIRLKGKVGRTAVLILIDSGSSHTFLSQSSARELKCDLQQAPPMRVKVANGESLMSTTICKDFTWYMQNQKFMYDVRVLPLKDNDLVLGCNWLKTISPVEMDFEKLSMTFQWQGKQPVLQGVEENGCCKSMTGRVLQKLVHKHQNSVIIGQLMQVQKAELVADIPEFMSHILVQFADVFAVPKTLPPERSCDHSIPLSDPNKTINIRPYRYSPVQKDEIKKLVNEMLATEIIQPSHIPFASPVLLVKKKDGSWRFCVDYRGLNAITVKDKFPIPMIDDLLDELSGSAYFTKLDLRAGYHQIRMQPTDQYKTAFRTHHGHFEFRVMPFGLTNAPATFQSLMNEVLAPYLRKFVLVFFDDILIYSATPELHQHHVILTLQLLMKHFLYAKKSKCSFGQQRVEYLGHIVTHEGVSTDDTKIRVMLQWPVPTLVRALRGFLGLTGYYRKFIKNYSIISKPLTDLLKKNMFKWTEGAAAAFLKLQQAMTEAPVLALPNFPLPFTLETDASGTGIGAVLSQQGRPIAYISQAVSKKNQGLSTYEKEYLAVLFAVSKWRHYLEGRHFSILTDHESLKYLLEQKVHTHIQKKGLVKLLGLDFEIRYRQGKYNRVVDALSRVHDDEESLSITAVLPDWILEVEGSYEQDEEAQNLILALTTNSAGPSMHSYEQGLLRYKGSIYVGSTGDIRRKLLDMFHSSPTGGHSGGQATYQRIKQYFYWPGLKKDVITWVAACHTCQQCKTENIPYPGLLQPLPIPDQAWKHISMDFIEGLPKSGGKNVILVVVDRFTKYGHFIPLNHPYTAVTVAQSFMDGVFKLHGMPTTIVTDRDAVFTSVFWKELFKLQGTQLHYSTTYHPQTDGQTERLNRCLEDYLRCMVQGQPKQWYQHLTMAEWWYNTNYHSSLKITPFQALYGHPPTVFSIPNPIATAIGAVEDRLHAHQQLIHQLQNNLQNAQSRQKVYVDKHRIEREFAVGDGVYLKLHPYRQSTVAKRTHPKLSPRYYGPFTITKRIGAVAYELDLPKDSQIHPVFHVSLLKKSLNPGIAAQTQLPVVDADGGMKLEPLNILARRFVKKNNVAVTEVLVHWSHQNEVDASWEEWSDFNTKFPNFQA
ncbi:Transposon Tf2-9 polyprotein [Linum perenne]